MLYPEVAPAAPITREELAHLLAIQNASGDYDPGAGEDSAGGGQAVSVSGYGRTGDDTSAQSQASQGRDAAAMAAAAQAAGRDFATDTQGNAITGPLSGPGFGALSTTTANDPISENAVATTAITEPGPTQAGQAYSGPNFGTPGRAGVLGDQFDAFSGGAVTPTGSPGLPSMVSGFPSTSFVSDLFDTGKNAVAQGWGSVNQANTDAAISANAIGSIVGNLGFGPGFGFGSGSTAAAAPGGSSSGGRGSTTAGSAVDNTGSSAAGQAAIGSIMAGVGGWGGNTGFSSTGGYEGSASMSNTGGAQGFGGGAVGGFGGGTGSGDGAGSGSGGGSGGSSSDGSSSSGDTTGGSSGVG